MARRTNFATVAVYLLASAIFLQPLGHAQTESPQDAPNVAASANAAGTASISGRITAPDGSKLLAIVTLEAVASIGSNSAPAPPQHLPTDTNGAFQFPGLPAGNYTLCAQPIAGQAANPDQAYLDTCEWNSNPFSAQLAAGQSLAAGSIVIPAGSVLNINVNDPQALLSLSAGPSMQALAFVSDGGSAQAATNSPPPIRSGPDQRLQLLIKNRNQIHFIPLISRKASTLQYAIALPRAVSLGFSATSSQFHLFDGANRPITIEVPVQASAGSKLPPITITIRR